MVDVIYAETNQNGTASTVAELVDNEGKVLIMVAVDRSGGESAAFAASSAALEANMSQAVGLATLPGDTNARRSVWIWWGVIPNVGGDRIIDMEVFDGTASAVDCSWIALIVDMDATWSLEATATADTGASQSGNLVIGPTGAAAAGQTVTVAALAVRGDCDVIWQESTDTPPNPGGGNWDLSVTTITGSNNSRFGSVGWGDRGSQPSQTYTDNGDIQQFDDPLIDEFLMATGALAVFVQSAVEGSLSGSLPALGASFTAESDATVVEGDLIASFPAMTGSFTATQVIDGTLSGVLPGLTASFTAELVQTVDGDLQAVLPALTASLAGGPAEQVEATLSGVLPVLRSTIQGETVNPLFKVDVRPRGPDILRAFPVRWPRG